MSTIKTIPSPSQDRAGGDFIGTLLLSGVVLLIFAQYLTTAIPAYLILMLGLLLKRGVRLPPKVVLYLCAVVCYWFVILGYSISKTVVTHVLFYFGFLIPFLAFAGEKRLRIESFVNEKNIVILCILTLLEAVLFNSPIGEQLYFFPAEGIDRVSLLGFYQRPMGIGGNPSMTSGVLFFLIALSERIWGPIRFRTLLLVIATTIVMASGTGFGLLLLYLLISALRPANAGTRYIQAAFTLAILGFGIAVAFGLFGEFEDFNKFTADYFSLMYEYKKFQFETMFEGAALDIDLFGNQINPDFMASTTGDAGLLITPYSIGIVGSLILFSAPLVFFSAIRKFMIPAFFFYVAFIHYPGLLTPPGQVLFACFLCLLMEASRQHGRGRSYSGQPASAKSV